jgi:hypothetical protein
LFLFSSRLFQLAALEIKGYSPMKTSRAACFLLTISLFWFTPSTTLNAQRQTDLHRVREGISGSGAKWLISFKPALVNYHSEMFTHAEPSSSTSKVRDSGGVKEDIPNKYRARYQQWKNEFLSTEFGRRQWGDYTRKTEFDLTIEISANNPYGATTGKYKWSDSGELKGVTITLGYQIDEGYPDPVYYPVMNSLSLRGQSHAGGGNILAATKIAHEFGHVNRATSMDGRLYRLQNQLMPVYKTIFLSNGYNLSDPRLVKLAGQMGGTSVEIWEDREYWGEANAMLYLNDRISEKEFRCSLYTRIKRSVEEYAGNYADRFKQIAQSGSPLCGWQ